MIYRESICFKCKYFDIETSMCPAFEDGIIPQEILAGANDHTKPLPEQKNDIVFEPIEQ